MENSRPVRLRCGHQGEEAEDTAGEQTTKHSFVLLLLAAQQCSNTTVVSAMQLHLLPMVAITKDEQGLIRRAEEFPSCPQNPEHESIRGSVPSFSPSWPTSLPGTTGSGVHCPCRLHFTNRKQSAGWQPLTQAANGSGGWVLSPSKLGEEKDICPQPRWLKSVSLKSWCCRKTQNGLKKRLEHGIT